MRPRCLALDHDDTVVQSSSEIHYPSFLEAMRILRPERAGMGFEEFISYSCAPGMHAFLTEVLALDAQEMRVEQEIWRKYTLSHIPDAYDGFAALLARFRAQGGYICVISHSEREIIERHYRELFGFLPDLIFGWEQPEHRRKPNPYPLEETMRVFELRPEEILLVDDLTPGLAMAAACGVPSAYAGWSHTAPAVGARVRPHATYAFDTVAELAAFLEDGEGEE